MKLIFDKPLGLGNPLAPDQKQFWWVPLAAAGVSAAASLFGNSQQSGLTKEQMRLQSRLNKEEMGHSMKLQENYQKMMYGQGTSAMTQGMKNAGLNPAMAGGGTPGVAGASASPHTGPAGPAATASHLGSDVAAGIQAGLEAQKTKNDTDVAASQVELNKALKNKTESETNNIDEDTKIKQWQNSPRYRALVENGLDASAAKEWAAANLSDKQAMECMAKVQEIGKRMQLTDEEINKVQAETAKLYKEIQEITQGMKESESRILLNYAKIRTESAMQNDLNASAADHRAGVVQKHADARLKGAEKLGVEQKTKLDKIETKMKEFKQKAIEIAGDAGHHGSVMFVKDILNMVNPFGDISLSHHN